MSQHNNPYHISALQKARQILREGFGEHAEKAFSARNVSFVMHAVKAAFAQELGHKQAEEVGFNMADWGADAALVVALHLFPDRFTADEIREATFAVAQHVHYHVNNVATVLDVFGERALEPGEQPGGASKAADDSLQP